MSKSSKKSNSTGSSHRRKTFKKHSRTYEKVYWPYLPIALIFGLFIYSFTFFSNGNDSGVLSYAEDIKSESLVDSTNQKRQDAGVASLTLNENLSQAAKAKAQDMVSKNYWSHISPDGSEPWVFVEKFNYKYLSAAENLAYGFSDSQSVINGWMNSPTHKAIMLDGTFEEVGFGVENAPDFLGKGENTIIVALYAKPALEQNQSTESATTKVGTPSNTSFAEAFTDKYGALLNFVLGLLIGISAMYLFVKHGYGLHRMLIKGEKFVLKHPAFDLIVLALIMFCLFMMRNAGYIH